MDRRFGIRVSTDCRLTAYVGTTALDCRAVDLSAAGALVWHARPRDTPLLQRFEVHLVSRASVPVLARTVWSRGHWQAVRFIEVHDVDRLEIAEHLDWVQRIAAA